MIEKFSLSDSEQMKEWDLSLHADERWGYPQRLHAQAAEHGEPPPREMEISIVGLEGAKMWTGEIAREKAARSLRRTVPADETETLRAYVVAPAGTAEQDFAFRLQAADKRPEADTAKVRFAAPGGAP